MARVLTQLHKVGLTCMVTRRQPAAWTLWTSTRHQNRTLSSAAGSSPLVNIAAAGGQSFNPVWLRQNCRCPDCFNHNTHQNNILPHQVHDAKPQDVITVGDDVTITWADGHQSKYSASWLLNNSYPGQPDKTEKALWTGSAMKSAVASAEFPSVSSEKLLAKESAQEELVRSLVRYGLGLVVDVPATVEDTQKCVERVSFIEETMFGRMWSFTSDMARMDTAYTKIPVASHTDTTYLTIPAGIQVFHCIHHDGDGGETVLVDGFQAAESLRRTNPKAFDILASTKVHHQYIEPGWSALSLDSILKVHPVSQELECIRFNHYDRAPITTVRQEQLQPFYDALAELSHVIEDPANQYWLKLKPGMVLFVDNWRVLHGRSSFTGNRRICGCYLPRTYWQGQARLFNLL